MADGTNIPELYVGRRWPGDTTSTAITYSFITAWPNYFTDLQKQQFSLGGDVSAPGQLTPSEISIVTGILQYIQTITNIHFVPVTQDNANNAIGQLTFALYTPQAAETLGENVTSLGIPGGVDPDTINTTSGDIYLRANMPDDNLRISFSMK